MSHIKLSDFVSQHAHAGRMRKRQKKLKPVRPSRQNELWYKVELLKVVRHISAVTEARLMPALRSAAAPVGDALPQGVSRQFEILRGQFGQGIDQTADRLSRLAAQKNLQTVDKRLTASIRSALRVDIAPVFSHDGSIRSAVQDAIKANVDLITSIPDKYLEKLESKLNDLFVEGSTEFDSLQDLVQYVGHVTESRAKLIARDQTSKMNGKFNQARQTSIGITKYTWQTADDERVRETHADNDGQTFEWDSPPEETGNPGDDINCRCVTIPEFDMDDDESSEEDNEDETESPE